MEIVDAAVQSGRGVIDGLPKHVADVVEAMRADPLPY